MTARSLFIAAATLTACLPALAQSTHMMMPEGSKQIYVGLATVYGPSANGSTESRIGIVPIISAQWANGMFVNMNSVGFHMSERDDLQYGPQVRLMRSRPPSENGKSVGSRFTPEVGGFVSYSLAPGMTVSSRLMYGGSSDHRGLRVHSGASVWKQTGAHHAFGVEAGVTLANRSSLQADFSVRPGGTLPVHEVDSGWRDASVTLHWSWEFNHKTTVRAWVEEQRFLGSARASPRLATGGGTTAVAMVLYSF